MAPPDRSSLRSALAAFGALPAVLAFAMPLLLAAVDPWRGEFTALGLLIVAGGSALLVVTVVQFFTVGCGTLAPWDPPRALVTSGPFAWSRNPMYVGVVLVVIGWSASFRSPVVLAFAVVLALGFHVRIVRHEEPWASTSFGQEWAAYAASVPRWLPRPRRRRGAAG